MAKRDHDCTKCKYGVLLVGAYTGTHYVECKFEQEACEKANTLEELRKLASIDLCQYKKGKAIDGGVTYDD